MIWTISFKITVEIQVWKHCFASYFAEGCIAFVGHIILCSFSMMKCVKIHFLPLIAQLFFWNIPLNSGLIWIDQLNLNGALRQWQFYGKGNKLSTFPTTCVTSLVVYSSGKDKVRWAEGAGFESWLKSLLFSLFSSFFPLVLFGFVF